MKQERNSDGVFCLLNLFDFKKSLLDSLDFT